MCQQFVLSAACGSAPLEAFQSKKRAFIQPSTKQKHSQFAVYSLQPFTVTTDLI